MRSCRCSGEPSNDYLNASSIPWVSGCTAELGREASLKDRPNLAVWWDVRRSVAKVGSLEAEAFAQESYRFVCVEV